MWMLKRTQRAEPCGKINLMLGHRGVRLGITYPEIRRCNRAIFEAAAELIKEGKKARQIMILLPVMAELNDQKAIVDRVYAEVCQKHGLKDPLHVQDHDRDRRRRSGHQDGGNREFFSFGTSDLTDGLRLSRDDIGSFPRIT